ncbi:MAG TPA: LemA family protein [Candidatus Acidoferrales bacterium]|nr:LemA family protein [Candidatus Acidoferrales bacterium]
MKKLLVALVAVAALGVVARLRFLSTRDSLSAQRETVSHCWGTVETALRDHAELLPALAGKVNLTPKLQVQTQLTIAAARAVLDQPAGPQEKIQAYSQLTREAARLLLAADQDSRMQADKDFLLLKEQLTDTDNRVLVARRKYNEALERYNASLSVFPHNLVAALSGFSRNDAYFKTAPDERASSKE